MNAAVQYGARRIVIGVRALDRGPYAADETVEPCGDSVDPLRAASARAAGLPPWSTVVVEEYRGVWCSLAEVQTRPMPGWAHPEADYCRTCGCVAFRGADLACEHKDYAYREPKDVAS